MIQRIAIALAGIALTACATTAPQSAPARLETTPRHDEWVTIESAGRPLHAYVVYPESNRKSLAVLVIHENRGLTDWVRGVADELAKHGYLAIAPDMLSGAAPNGGRTSDFESQDAAREAISKLPPAQVRADLLNTAAYVRALPAANGKLAVAGFCWGGARAWEVANSAIPLEGAFVFYGTGPREPSGVAQITAPVYGFYGENDERVNATIAETRRLMEARNIPFHPVIYEGSGHAFMRLGEQPDASAANRTAREKAWERWLRLLREIE